MHPMMQPTIINAIGGKSIRPQLAYQPPSAAYQLSGTTGYPNNVPEPNSSRKKATMTKIRP